MLFYYDFETTGLNPFHNKIIEYSFLNTNGMSIQSLINPESTLSQTITRITGITNQMIQDSPTIDNKKEEIIKFLNMHNTECIYIVAHNNCNFDRFFFRNIFKNDPLWEPILNSKVRYIDSIHLAKYILPNQRFSLQILCKYFNITPGTHRAHSDTQALKLLFEKLLQLLSKKENISVEEFIKNPKLIYNTIY